jgi:hypothetical protein
MDSTNIFDVFYQAHTSVRLIHTAEREDGAIDPNFKQQYLHGKNGPVIVRSRGYVASEDAPDEGHERECCLRDS